MRIAQIAALTPILYWAVIVGLVPFLFSACMDQCWNKNGAREYRLLAKTSEPTNVRLVRDFSEYPVERQIDIFLYAKDCPNDGRFEPILARGGAKVVPAIVHRIETEYKVLDKSNLLGVLTTINAECKCVANDFDTIRRLEAVARTMDQDKTIPEDYTYKRMYKDELEFLKRQALEKPR